MDKQIQKFQLSTVLLMMRVIATPALFFSSCKKKGVASYYTVTFDSKDGTKIEAIKVKKGNTLTLPVAPIKDGFTFDGWYTDDGTFKNPFDTRTVIAADLILYAKWIIGAPAPAVFSLSSTSFTNGGEIPPRYAYANEEQADRLNISPQLSWANAPAGTKSFLIIMSNLDFKYYPNWTFNWIVFNIPSSKTSLAENETSVLDVEYAYTGPNPPAGYTQNYQITIFALKKAINYFNGTNKSPTFNELVIEELKGDILASSYITGKFTST